MGPPRVPLRERFEAKVDKSIFNGDCWEWQGAKDSCGYGVIGEGGFYGKQLKTHRVAVMLDGRDIPEGMLVMHSCDNPPCCNPSHLTIGTDADNHRDRNIKGRQAKGVKNGRSKLTEDDVRDIRCRLTNLESKLSIARRYCVDPKSIRLIESGKNWGHVV
mgnify:CR=1 FL=1